MHQAARVTVLRGVTLLAALLAATPCRATTSPAALVSHQGAVQQDLQQQQQQVAPLVVPQWWWLSSMLSLPHGHHGHNIAAAISRKGATINEEAGEGEAATLPLVLPLDQLGTGDESYPAAAAAGRLGKRGAVCRKGGCRRGELPTMSVAEVRENWGADYLSIPEALVSFSQQQTEDQVCKDLSVQLFRVDLRQHLLEPVWVREIVHLGVCPSMLQERRLGENVWPSSVVEVKCLCQQASCSNMGGDFRCQAVRRPVRTWVRHGSQTFKLSQETVSVGCVCVQRTGTEAKHVSLLEG